MQVENANDSGGLLRCITSYRHLVCIAVLPSVLWRCWLGGRKGIRPVKTEWWGTGVVIFLERGADLHMAQLMPLPLTVSCFSKIHIGFTSVVPAHLGSPGQRAVKRVCVCAVCIISCFEPVFCHTLAILLQIAFGYSHWLCRLHNTISCCISCIFHQQFWWWKKFAVYSVSYALESLQIH